MPIANPFRFEGPKEPLRGRIEPDDGFQEDGGGLDPEIRRNLLGKLRADPADAIVALGAPRPGIDIALDPELRQAANDAVERLVRDGKMGLARIVAAAFHILPSRIRRLAETRQDFDVEAEAGPLPASVRAELVSQIAKGKYREARTMGERFGLSDKVLLGIYLSGILAHDGGRRRSGRLQRDLEEGMKVFPCTPEDLREPALRSVAIRECGANLNYCRAFDPDFAFSDTERQEIAMISFRGQTAGASDLSLDGFIQILRRELGDFPLPAEIEDLVAARAEAVRKNGHAADLLERLPIGNLRIKLEALRMGEDAYMDGFLRTTPSIDRIKGLLEFVYPAPESYLRPEMRSDWLRILEAEIRKDEKGFSRARDFFFAEQNRAELRGAPISPDMSFDRLLADPAINDALGEALVRWSGYSPGGSETQAPTMAEMLPLVGDKELPASLAGDPQYLRRYLRNQPRNAGYAVGRTIRAILSRQKGALVDASWFADVPLPSEEKERWKASILRRLSQECAEDRSSRAEEKYTNALKLLDARDLVPRVAWARSEMVDKRIRESREFGRNLFVVPRDSLLARQTHRISPNLHAWLLSHDPEALAVDAEGRPDAGRLVRGMIAFGRGDEVPQDVSDHVEGEGAAAAEVETGLVPDLLSRGVERFGAPAVLRYLNRPDLAIHDGVHFWNKLFAFQDRLGIDGRSLTANLLDQVAKDGSSYPEGSAHLRFAAVVDQVWQVDLAEFFDGIDAYLRVLPDPEIRAWIDVLRADSKEVCGGWRQLKKFAELLQLLKQKEVLEDLAHEPNPRLRAYAGRLIFHPDISTTAVQKLYKDPKEFFAEPDEHGQTVAPSEWCDFPELALRPEELRDALVGREGAADSALDRVQLIPPFQAEYRIGPDPFDPARFDAPDELHRAIVETAIGKLREKRPGIARDPKRLLTGVQRLLGSVVSEAVFPASEFPAKDSAKRFQAFAKPETGVPLLRRCREADPASYAALKALLVHPEFGMPIVDDRPCYRVTVWKKSDPAGAIAGNDTACCMPFGSGKKVHYDMSPGCAQFTLERLVEDEDGRRWRTAAQSVLTKDRELTVPHAKAMEAIRRLRERAGELDALGPMSELDGPMVLTADNIEIAKNELGSRTDEIRGAYQKFAQDYLRLHAGAMAVDPTRMLVGEGYSPPDLAFDRVPNHAVPAIPTSYTDNYAETCFVVRTGLPAAERKRPTGISELAPTDVLAVAALEQKAFSDIPYMVEGLKDIQQKIQAQRVAAELRGSPNLSFIYRDGAGIPRGYVVAYEGRLSDRPDERWVYIDDMAADPEARTTGGARLIHAFLERFFEAYAKDDAVPIPIRTHARESTSFKVIENQAVKRAAARGLVAVVDDRSGSFEAPDPDAFHDVAIGFGRTEAEARRQLARLRSIESRLGSGDGYGTQDDEAGEGEEGSDDFSWEGDDAA